MKQSPARSLISPVLLLVCAVCGHSVPAADQPASANVHLRGALDNCRVQFEQQKKGHVAFMGGSITEMNGYRPMVCEILKKRFPATEFTFTDAGLSSTCSTTGAFRLQTDVLGKGPVDVFFIEFAVNDDQDANHTRQECIRGMEGIIRQALRHNPNMDIVITHFINPEMMETLKAGKTPLTAGAHEEVADRYGVSTINLAKEVTGQIVGGQLTWNDFGGVHPAPRGNAICAGMIDQLMQQAWSKPLAGDTKKAAHALPPPLDPLNYENGRFVDPRQATLVSGWKVSVPEWKSLKGSTRKQFNTIPLLCADQPGAELKLEFTGTAVGAFVVAGPDAGVVEAHIDGGQPVEANLYHRFSSGLHYPRTVMFAADLKPGPHTLMLRVSDKTTSAGHAARIVQFVAN
ncbi:MAG: GDSL-type esterase/lipase family protein [Tepidisphaerales bacterium]